MLINLDGYDKEGLYLILTDGGFLDLSKERVRLLADEYWNNPAKLPPHVRQHDVFKTCSVCPFKGQSVFCSAMKPLLPFLEEMDRFNSFDRVTAVYVKKKGVVKISETNMQTALQYVTNMAVFEYCEDAKQYLMYFKGIEPLMDMKETLSRLFMNIYWINGGNWQKAQAVIEEMRYAITVTSKNCVERLNLMCNSDAFVNAYVKTHILAEMLRMNIDETLGEYFRT